MRLDRLRQHEPMLKNARDFRVIFNAFTGTKFPQSLCAQKLSIRSNIDSISKVSIFLCLLLSAKIGPFVAFCRVPETAFFDRTPKFSIFFKRSQFFKRLFK